MVYERGYGVSRNLNRALNWYRQAAENGSIKADEGWKRCSKLIEKEKKDRLKTLTAIRKCFEQDYMEQTVTTRTKDGLKSSVRLNINKKS